MLRWISSQISKKRLTEKFGTLVWLRLRFILFCTFDIQGVFEMRAEILITSYWLHLELGKNI
jgi:hypothetical protein